MIRIGVDAMGGDYAPEAVVLGAIAALREIGADSRITLFGDREAIESILSRENCSADSFDIVPTTQVIEMGEHPAQTFIKKPDSSIAVGFGYLQSGKIDGFASAGSTGAMLVGSMYTVKPIEGVIRPTISSLIPTVGGHSALLLDVGLNVDCKPEVLCQYGILGSIFAQGVLGLETPRVGLLNIGEEREKGNQQTRTAYELMSECGLFNFVGNIEAKHVFAGDIADVIVCDGFVGNTMLKEAEGFYEIIKNMSTTNAFIEGLNYENVGGTPVLGINAPVIIGHGCSTPRAIKNMILQTEKTVKADLGNKLRAIFNQNQI